LLTYAFPGNGAINACWRFLASLPRIDIESILGNGTRNACWHFLALPLELVYPSDNTKECQLIGHNVYRCYPQMHGSIVVAFHPKVLSGYHYLYFPKGSLGNKSSDMDMSKTDIRAYYPYDHTWVNGFSIDSGHTRTHLTLYLGDRGNMNKE
jgi:hypothetical protein